MSRPGAGARIAVVKPDWGLMGGYELVVEHIERELADAGHAVQRVSVDARALGTRPYDLAVPEHVWTAAPEYFRYLSLWEAFAATDVTGYDLVVTTQPASWAVDHSRKVAVFYHHHRIFYDLSDRYLQAGFATPQVHLAAQAQVRSLDQPCLEGTSLFLAPPTPAKRLAVFNGCTNVTTYNAGPAAGTRAIDERPDAERAAARRSGVGTLCVSRSEFPKRTELFVAAMHLAPSRRGHLVGTGGRLDLVRALDARATVEPNVVGQLDPAALWCNADQVDPAAVPPPDPRSNVTIHGWVGDDALAHLYRSARCLVAPAYDEDYGLTAIEAMVHGLPVIVCRDGGGLADIVEDGRSGLVVDPTPAAVAAAVDRLHADDDLAEQLALGALDRAAAFTWDQAAEELRAGVAGVLELLA